MQKNITEHVTTHDVLATARWGEPDYMAQLYPYKEGSFWLGRNPHNPYQALGYEGEGHIFLAAGARSGKGRSIIINNLIKWPGSIVSIDPKGLNATITAVRRGQGNQHCKGMGQDVYVLDPMNCADVPDGLRAHYNLLDALDPNSGDLAQYANLIADAISVIPDGGGDSADWADRGRKFISLIIQWAVCSPHIQDKDRNLLTVRNLIMEGEHQRSVELKKQGIQVDPYQILLDDMKESPANGGRIAMQARSIQKSIDKIEKYIESTRVSALDHLEFLDTDGMENTIANTGTYPRTFKLSELRTSKNGLSVFLCLPPHNAKPYGRWQKAMINLILAEMQKHKTKPVIGHDLLMSIDEFPILGHMDKIVEYMNFISESGVKLFLACQHIINLKDIYGDNFEQFIAGSKLQIWFAPGGKFTGEYLSHMLGETEIVKYQRNINQGQNTLETHGTMSQDSVSEQESVSHAKGTNTNQAYSTGHTDNWNQADTASISDNWSKTSGWNKNWQKNKNKNWGKSDGKAAGRNYGPHVFFEGFEHGTNYNNQTNHSRGGSSGSGFGGGTSGSETRGGGSQFGHTNSYGGSDTENLTNSFGINETDTYQTGTTKTHASGTQYSQAQGESLNAGITETFHKKPLLTVHEAELFLKAVDDPKHDAFPGLALVKIQGELPFLVRKIHYDQDRVFEHCFNPHPSHPYLPYSRLPLLEYEYTDDYYIPIVTPKELLDKGYLIAPIKGLKQGQLIEKSGDVFGLKSPFSNTWQKAKAKHDLEVVHIFGLDHRTETGEAMIVRHREKFDDPAVFAKEFRETFLAELWQPLVDWVREEKAEIERQRRLAEEEAERKRRLEEEAVEIRRKREAEEAAEAKRKKRIEEAENTKRETWRNYMTEENQLIKLEKEYEISNINDIYIYIYLILIILVSIPIVLLFHSIFFDKSYHLDPDYKLKTIFSDIALIGFFGTNLALRVRGFFEYKKLKRELGTKKTILIRQYGKNPFE